jgi:hypothetical protein
MGGLNFKKKGVESQGSDISQISQEQTEVLYLLTEEYLTPRQISIRRKTSVAAVYKTMTKLRNKGLLKGGLNRGLKKKQSTNTIQPPATTKKFRHFIRLHGQEWNVKILYKSERYDILREKSNRFIIDDNTVRLYKNSMEIYSAETLMFEAEDEQRATSLSFQYWNKIFKRLEHDLGIILIKNRCHNFKIVNSHYAEIDNELAKEYNKRKVILNIYGTDDGKLWFKIDNSWQLHEAETLHPERSKKDMTRVKALFNDIRDNDHIPISRISQYLADSSQQINELSHYAKILSSFLVNQGGLKKPQNGIDRSKRPDYVL